MIETFDEYQKKSLRTLKKHTSNTTMLNEAALGIGGEAGEFIDHVKKVVFHGHDLDKSYLVKELGDVLWYIAEACQALEINMSEVATQNFDKLCKRYPEQFSIERSINRSTKQG